MKQKSNLMKNTIIYALGNIVSKVLNFVLLPFYTKFLTVSNYGVYDLVINSVMLICPFINMKVNNGMYRFLLNNDQSYKKEKEIVNSSFFLVVRNLFVFNVLYFIIMFYIKKKYMLLILFYIDSMILSSFMKEYVRAKKQNLIYSLSDIIYSIVMLFMNIILICFTNMRVEALLISNIIANITIVGFIEYKNGFLRGIDFGLRNISIEKSILKYSIPLIPTGICWWIMEVSDRYLIKYYCGTFSNGIYAIANKIPAIIILFQNVFFLAWQETAITQYDCNKDTKSNFYTDMFNKFMVFQITAAIVLISYSKLILNIMVDDKFYSAFLYMPTLYVGIVFSSFSTFLGSAYQCVKKTKWSLITVIVGASTNIILNFIFIPMIKIHGAAMSTMISFIVMWIIRKINTKQYFNIKLNVKVFFQLSILLGMTIIVYFINNKFLNIVILILSIIIFVLYNRKLIKNLLKIICKTIENKINRKNNNKYYK